MSGAARPGCFSRRSDRGFGRFRLRMDAGGRAHRDPRRRHPTTYTVADIADRITTRLLVLSPENEQFWPGQSAQLVELTAEVSTLAHFTAAEGADGLCQPLARALTAERMFDWLDEQLA